MVFPEVCAYQYLQIFQIRALDRLAEEGFVPAAVALLCLFLCSVECAIYTHRDAELLAEFPLL